MRPLLRDSRCGRDDRGRGLEPGGSGKRPEPAVEADLDELDAPIEHGGKVAQGGQGQPARRALGGIEAVEKAAERLAGWVAGGGARDVHRAAAVRSGRGRREVVAGELPDEDQRPGRRSRRETGCRGRELGDRGDLLAARGRLARGRDRVDVRSESGPGEPPTVPSGSRLARRVCQPATPATASTAAASRTVVDGTAREGGGADRADEARGWRPTRRVRGRDARRPPGPRR